MGGRQIEHSSSKLGQSVGSMESPCLCAKPVKQLFLFPRYNVFALASLLLLRLHLLPLLLPCPESVGVIILCVCQLCVLLNSHS